MESKEGGVTGALLQNRGGNDWSVYLRKGASAVMYLVPAWDGTPRERTDTTVDNPKAGRPDGQALFMTTPQGDALPVGEKDVVAAHRRRGPGKDCRYAAREVT
jgi:hypothetical protein